MIKKSIIIPTCKSEHLIPCLKSIVKYTDLYPDIEIIIVANGYDGELHSDGSVVLETLRDSISIEHWNRNFRIVNFPERIGYTRATNEGIKAATGEILILMNDDVVLLPQEKNTWINYLCDPLKDNVGMTGNLKIWDDSVQRNFLVGFLVAIPRWLWDRVGPFDEKTWSPGGGEDIELCLKIENLGYKIIQVPDENNQVINGINVNRFPSYHKGEGTVLAPDFKDIWIPHINYVRKTLKEKYQLPDGWFYGADIAEYRRLVEDVPEGGIIGELGCYKGRSLCSVADIILRKKLRVYIVDIFTGTESEKKEDDYQKEFERNAGRFGIHDNISKIYKATTDEAVEYFDTGVFDLLFIDADHSYESVKKDLDNWARTIRPGGTISGHDYGNHPGVSKAVNEKWSGVRVHDQHFGIDSGIAQGSVWSKRL